MGSPWRVGGVCVALDEKGVTIEDFSGGSTLTSSGGGCSLEEFLEGQLRDAIPDAIRSEVVEEATRLAPPQVRASLERKRREADEASEKVRRAEREWAALIRNIAQEGPPKLWDLELLREVTVLARLPEHVTWARPFLVHLLLVRDPEVLGACVDGLSTPSATGWVAVDSTDCARLGAAGERAQLPYWIRELPSCPACGNKGTALVFCQDGERRDPFYDSYDAAAEVHCAACGAFSLHVRHEESRN
jgi:hypothetical protein